MGEARRIGVYGRSGSGKSTHAKELLETAKYPRVIIFDQTGEYKDLKGFRQVETSADEKDLRAAMRRKTWKIVYQSRVEHRSPQAALHRVSVVVRAAAQAAKQADGLDGVPQNPLICFYVEEIGAAFPVTAIKKEHWGFGDLCARGRHMGVEIIAVSQRISGVNNEFKGNANVSVIFPPGNSAADMNAARDLVPAHFKAKISELVDHEYVKITGSNAEIGKNKPLKKRGRPRKSV